MTSQNHPLNRLKIQYKNAIAQDATSKNAEHKILSKNLPNSRARS